VTPVRGAPNCSIMLPSPVELYSCLEQTGCCRQLLSSGGTPVPSPPSRHRASSVARCVHPYAAVGPGAASARPAQQGEGKSRGGVGPVHGPVHGGRDAVSWRLAVRAVQCWHGVGTGRPRSVWASEGKWRGGLHFSPPEAQPWHLSLFMKKEAGSTAQPVLHAASAGCPSLAASSLSSRPHSSRPALALASHRP